MKLTTDSHKHKNASKMTWSGFDNGFSRFSTEARMNTVGLTGKPGGWESLRKNARTLENEIDLKLVSYSKLGTNYSRHGAQDQQPLLSTGDSKIESLGAEIETLIEQLGNVNESMAEFASTAGQSAAIHHTLQRHTEILQDYRQEFRKTAANIAAIVEREDLLNSVHNDISDYKAKDKGKVNQRMDALLRESEHTRNSERMIDEQINIALETRESLVNQRIAFKTIQTKLNDLTNKFPLINNLVNKINFRKRRDSIIIGCVIGLCLIALLWYMFG